MLHFSLVTISNCTIVQRDLCHVDSRRTTTNTGSFNRVSSKRTLVAQESPLRSTISAPSLLINDNDVDDVFSGTPQGCGISPDTGQAEAPAARSSIRIENPLYPYSNISSDFLEAPESNATGIATRSSAAITPSTAKNVIKFILNKIKAWLDILSSCIFKNAL